MLRQTLFYEQESAGLTYRIVVATVSDAASPAAGTEAEPYDYVVVSTKQLPESYSVADLIRPVVTPGVTSIILIQNGLNIETPLISAFPGNTVITGVSMIGSRTVGDNGIVHIGTERLILGPHFHDGVDRETQLQRAREFVAAYQAGGCGSCSLEEDMGKSRWQKVLWNGTFNTLCALMGMDVGELQTSGGRETMLLPMMWELVAIAKADGYELPAELVQKLAFGLPDDCPYRPSMLLDMEHGRPMEIEVILGNPLRKAKLYGVDAPKCQAVYELLKLAQWKNEQRALGRTASKSTGKIDGSVLM
jgi:2-dehydropantoate 2-reductase